jgi:hypothetical protein
MSENEKVAIRSLADDSVPRVIKDDLVALANAIPEVLTVATGNPVMVPKTATYRVSLVTRLSTASSTATDKHGLSLTRNGAAGVSSRWGTVTLPDTDEKEFTAYEPYFVGEVGLENNDFLEAVPVIYGNPSPMLTRSDMVLRIDEVRRGTYK